MANNHWAFHGSNKNIENEHMKKSVGRWAMVLALWAICVGWGGLRAGAQSISGTLTLLANQSIQLEGFQGLQSYPIATTTVDGQGRFQLSFSIANYGMGQLVSQDGKIFLIILADEDVQLEGETLDMPESIRVQKGAQNKWFEQYAREQPRREQSLSAWVYLERIYSQDPLFSAHTTTLQNILDEKQRIHEESAQFIAALPEGSYVHWFLPMQQLVNAVAAIAQFRPEEIPQTIAAFRAIDYSDARMHTSGLLKNAIEGHFWLLENSGQPLDTIFKAMRTSIDAMLTSLRKDENKLNAAGNYLFDLLERHSLFDASEYLAVQLLNESSCTLNADLARQLETYRAMKKGNTAPDIEFKGDGLVKGAAALNAPKKLSEIQSAYKVVVFGAGWCPKCTEELPHIATLYPKWKQHGVEVVLISLDENKVAFQQFAASFPFLSSCDYQKWDSPIVQGYHVFSTPTVFLLDAQQKIVLRPHSVQQLDAWVDWVLVQSNL